MIPVHFLHVHIGMLHGVLLTGRSIIIFELPSFIDLQPVFGIEPFEGSNEGFLICIKTDLLENNCDLVFRLIKQPILSSALRPSALSAVSFVHREHCYRSSAL